MNRMHRIRRSGFITSGFVLAILLSACTASGGSTGDAADGGFDAVTLTWASAVGPDHWTVAGINAWNSALNERTDGNVVFEPVFAGALGAPTEQSTTIGDGVAEIGEVFPAYEESKFPISGWIGNLAWQHDSQPLLGDLQTYLASIELGFEDALEREFTNQGLKPIVPNVQAVAANALLCREPVTALDEVRGMDVRVASTVIAAEAKAIGMNPTFLDATETYEALQRGIIDCAAIPPRDAIDWGLIDVAPHMTISTEGGLSGTMGTGVYMTMSAWKKLPTRTQDVLMETSRAFVRGQMDAILEENIEAFEQVDSLSSWDQDVVEVLTRHQEAKRERMLETGVPDGVSRAEVSRLLEAFDTVYADWHELLSAEGYDAWPTQYENYIEQYNRDGVDLEPALDAYVDRVVG